MHIRMILGLGDIGCGILFILICIPLVRRMIPMNHLYGFRIPSAFRSDEDWYEINEYGGRAPMWWSFGLIAAGFVKMFLPVDNLDDFASWVIAVGPIVTFTLIPITQTLAYAWRR